MSIINEESNIISNINTCPSYIRFIHNPNKNIQLTAIKLDGLVINLIKDPDPDVQLEAYIQNPFSIQFIKNLHIEIQYHILEFNTNFIKYIQNPCEEVKEKLKIIEDISIKKEFIDLLNEY